MGSGIARGLKWVAALGLAACASGCVGLPSGAAVASLTPAALTGTAPRISASPSERECLMRAMYFESIGSSEDGMLAVGTVVMNRVADPRYPGTICGVVGQKNQFAANVLSARMTETQSVALAGRVADRILSGARHPGVRQAQHFHTAGLRFPYTNMHYVLTAGGNAFYEKR